MRIDMGDRHLRAEVTGAGDTLITLLHGGLVDSTSWGELVPLLARRHRVLTFDIAGYGASDPAPDRDPLSGAAEDCVRLWDRLDVATSWVLGFSQGGLIALRAFARAAERIDGLILVSTAATLGPSGQAAMAARAIQVRRFGMDADVVAHLSRAFCSDFSDQHPEVLAAYSASVAKSDPDAVAATFEALAVADETEVLGGISIPTLVVAGEHDQAFRSAAARTAEAIPGSRFVTIRGVGHTIHVEQPETLANLVIQFLHQGDLLTVASQSSINKNSSQGELT